MSSVTVAPCPIDLSQVELPPGQTLTLCDINWQEFERILAALGNHTRARLTYSQTRLELRMPLPEHEKIKRFIAIVVEILLDALELDWEPYGSTTFKRQDAQVGIEPDDCFYIQNADQMTGLRRIDLAVDPPPDLVIEVDVTSPTRLEVYERLGVPELWRYRAGKLEIWQLQGTSQYIQSESSSVIPDFPVLEVMAIFLPRLNSESISRLKRELRTWVEAKHTSLQQEVLSAAPPTKRPVEMTKPDLLQQLANTEAVVWSPQTDAKSVQALSQLLVSEGSVDRHHG